ncbi:hypothetical protein AHF37_00379 [Paragonimus kellicotti]|nr:hypothetical protein AHF37_00379 [Paragonimus kellicotti]
MISENRRKRLDSGRNVRITHDDRPGTTRMIHRIRMTVGRGGHRVERITSTRLRGKSRRKMSSSIVFSAKSRLARSHAPQHMHPLTEQTIQFTPQLTHNINLRLHTGRHTGHSAQPENARLIGHVWHDCGSHSRRRTLSTLTSSLNSSSLRALRITHTSGFLTGLERRDMILQTTPLPLQFCHVPLFGRQQVAKVSQSTVAIANQLGQHSNLFTSAGQLCLPTHRSNRSNTPAPTSAALTTTSSPDAVKSHGSRRGLGEERREAVHSGRAERVGTTDPQQQLGPHDPHTGASANITPQHRRQL